MGEGDPLRRLKGSQGKSCEIITASEGFTAVVETMSRLFVSLLFFCSVSSVVPLFCHKCVIPAVSPLPKDCISTPTRCSPKQICLSSKSTATKGDLDIVLHEKNCALPSLCGVTGHKVLMGLNFTYTTECCDSNLCNGAAVPRSIFSVIMLLCLLISFLFFC